MDLSDDIAYSVHDFEDAIVGGYLDVPALGAARAKLPWVAGSLYNAFNEMLKSVQSL